MRRLLPLIALVVSLAALAGCTAANQNASAGSFKGAEKDVAQVVDDLKAARDPEEVCSRIFTDAFAKSLEADGHDCVDEVQATIRDTANTDMDVTDVTVTGDRATAKVSQDGKSATYELQKSGDSWQISSLGAAAS
jgi:hypothetical protein